MAVNTAHSVTALLNLDALPIRPGVHRDASPLPTTAVLANDPDLPWFISFPNAPNLITDFAYLDMVHYDVWQRVAIFTAFAITDLMLAMISLLYMHTLVRGRGVAWLTVVAAIAKHGLGLYMGHFLRWNSWDPFTLPGAASPTHSSSSPRPCRASGPSSFRWLLRPSRWSFASSCRRCDRGSPRGRS